MIGEAWQTGAAQLSAEQRLQLANDPLVLLAVDGPSNEAKGDGDASQWLPPDAAYRFPYAARQVAVKDQAPALDHPRRARSVSAPCSTAAPRRPGPTPPSRQDGHRPHDGAVSPPHRHPGPGPTRDGPHSAAGWLLG